MSYKRYCEIRYCWLYVEIVTKSTWRRKFEKRGYEIGRRWRGSILGRLSTHRQRSRCYSPSWLSATMGAIRRSHRGPWALPSSFFLSTCWRSTRRLTFTIANSLVCKIDSMPLDSNAEALLNLTDTKRRHGCVVLLDGVWHYLVKLMRSSREIEARKIEALDLEVSRDWHWIKIYFLFPKTHSG